ncbi:MAG: ABC transporter permease [Gordonia sp. (in: high G+C Gram-positive bacteria)]
MISLLRSEWIKLGTIRSPYWCAGLMVVLSVGITGLLAAVIDNVSDISGSPTTTDPTVIDGTVATVLLVGLNQFAVVVLMIMAVLGITSEYRFATIRESFLAAPKRPWVLGAKGIVYVAFGFLAMLLLTVVCLAILRVGIGRAVDFGASAVIHQIWGIPLYSALCVLFALGVGALVRHTAGAISLLLVWMLVVESILSAVPKVSDWFGPLLPFANGSRFLAGATSGDDFHWNSTVSLIYFAVWAVLVFAAGVFVVDRRDA